MTSPTFPLTETTFRQIVLNGQYYFPASNHYQRTTTVNCDRCQRTQIPACIGWREYDLCLGCAQLIVEQNAVMRVQPRIQPIPPMVTRMHISSAYPRQTQDNDQDRGPIRVTNMQVSSAFPTTNMQVSSAFPTTNMQVSSAFPTTYMQVSSAFPRQPKIKSQTQDQDPVMQLHARVRALGHGFVQDPVMQDQARSLGMQVSSAQVRALGHGVVQDQFDSEPFTFMHVSSAYPD